MNRDLFVGRACKVASPPSPTERLQIAFRAAQKYWGSAPKTRKAAAAAGFAGLFVAGMSLSPPLSSSEKLDRIPKSLTDAVMETTCWKPDLFRTFSSGGNTFNLWMRPVTTTDQGYFATAVIADATDPTVGRYIYSTMHPGSYHYAKGVLQQEACMNSR